LSSRVHKRIFGLTVDKFREEGEICFMAPILPLSCDIFSLSALVK
jgi:hypothetical protein